MEKMETRTYVIIGLIVLAAIFLIQNFADATLRILFIKIEMPSIIFYALLLGIGFLLGFLSKKKS